MSLAFRRPYRTMRVLGSCATLVGWLVFVPQAVPADEQDSWRALVEASFLQEDALFQTAVPDAHGEVSSQEDAAGGCDGIKTGAYGFHTASGEQEPWWQVDLGAVYELDRIVVYNRTDSGTAPRTRTLQVLVCLEPQNPAFQTVYTHDGSVFLGVEDNAPLVIDLRGKDIEARVVRLQIPGKCSFALDEVEVYAAGNPGENIALGKPADQKSISPYSRPSAAVADALTCSTAHIEHVFAQGHALAERLAHAGNVPGLAEAMQAFAALEAEWKALASGGVPDAAARRAIYLNARWALRDIAFRNPVFDFDRLLFVKRHDSRGVFHMCDQYYGFNAVPGGGLFVLNEPFGARPSVENLLAASNVEAGRLAGAPLEPGAFLSPELSYDGSTIYFAFTEALGEDLEWTPRSCYHLFRCNADGSGLVQLTDGPWNDFDPCELPNGRLAFISERRGGYLRCGRHCPTYAMYGMRADGSDIIPMSYHETHEWHPSVNHEGMIVYTRWDYVDRDTNVAHHIWTSYPDGRDPRSFHGNYPEDRSSRPWMEMSIRAIPGSHRYVATAAAHHGHAFGSLVLIDPRAADDNAMSQLTRLTPEVPFPESERHLRPIAECMVYGTPWPLSEDDYLCVYDPTTKNRGIYWLDRFGNRELLYRDPAISCLSPMPLAPRPKPPVLPAGTTQTAQTPPEDQYGTVAVMNIYESDFAWPNDAKVAALRVIQVLPKTTPPPNEPRIGVANQSNARAVLGTVPVAEDGSAHFRAPAGKLIYFQALDAQGLAIQSMRSATYLHAGETLTCLGCHEHKQRAGLRMTRVPAALQRPPSAIQPDVDGSNPFNYQRLVQPVLDRHCVECHREKGALPLDGEPQEPHLWARSYENLAKDYGFYFNVSNGSITDGVHGGSRTIPGAFGARAAKLFDYLNGQHYDAKPSQEDIYRLALWLDCNSEFFGAYENTGAQSRGEPVTPSLE
ncbi:MAG TPA: discoidin domain-containing protein [Candidatus Hydrogenedentes bacterium]|nr:discoidin domain-containing protein [Candidatus Hydrogenedentota bacterium]HOH32485.1 discoidin domain-containing protein [Candidatus Hydrogenedentota bacterium]